MFGMSSGVIDDSSRSLNPKPRKHVVDLLGGGVVHVFGDAGRHDPRTYHDWLAGNFPGDSFDVGTISPIDIFHVGLREGEW
jgi:hypothetical protein